MAGINKYSTLMYTNNEKQMEADDYDELDNSSRYRNSNRRRRIHRLMPEKRPGGVVANPATVRRSPPLPHIISDEQYQAYLESLNFDNKDIPPSLQEDINSENDLSLPLEKHRPLNRFRQHSYDEAVVRRYLGFGVQWVGLVTENLLSHPFIVLRRQCQVHHSSNRYHLHPMGLMPAIFHLHKRQGISTLWKGLGSCLLVGGLSMAVEDLLSKTTSLPKDINYCRSFKRFGQHVLLKGISIAVVTPFSAASLVETVQSDIASEKPGVFDVFREGGLRLLYWKYAQKGRMLPLWALIGPAVCIGLTKYFFGLGFKRLSARAVRRLVKKSEMRKGAKYKGDSLDMQNIEIYSSLVSMLTSEIFFYPFETILHRLQLQGTRTIIDNLDNGYAVVPILTNYQGAIDCCRTTIATEGFSGLYKGFGAIILQYAAHVAVIKLTKWVVDKISEIALNRSSKKIVPYSYPLERNNGGSNSSTNLSHSLSGSEGIMDAYQL